MHIYAKKYYNHKVHVKPTANKMIGKINGLSNMTEIHMKSISINRFSFFLTTLQLQPCLIESVYILLMRKTKHIWAKLF